MFKRFRAVLEWIEHTKLIWDFAIWLMVSLGGGAFVRAALMKFLNVSGIWATPIWLFSAAIFMWIALKVMPHLTGLKDSSQPTSRESKDDQLCKELKEIARDDATNISHRVRKIGQKIHFHSSPGSDPYIDVLMELLNTSIFEVVAFGEIDGHTTYAGEQLPANPHVSHETDLHGPMFLKLKHGESGTMRIRQFLSTERADRMWADKLRNIAVDMSFVAVVFKVLPLSGMRLEKFPVFGPRFTMDDVVRT